MPNDTSCRISSALTDMRIDVGAEVNLQPRDTIMLASDGLMDNVHVDEIIQRIRIGPLDEAIERVISLANRRMAGATAGQPSKPDDLSLILFRKPYDPKQPSGAANLTKSIN